MAKQPSVPYCSDMQPGDQLFANQAVYSQSSRYKLVMQSDGNLVEYGPQGAIWSTMTAGTSGAWFVQQGDGNAVVYNGSNQPLWWNSTMNGGTWLNIQDDGNIVSYFNGTPLWASLQHSHFGNLRAPGGRNPADAGYCTWWAEENFKGFMKRGAYPSWGGNAGDWDTTAAQQNWTVQSMPTTQAIVVFEPGATYGSLGHVAWVQSIQVRNGGVWFTVSEMNFPSRNFNRVTTRDVQAGPGMEFIPAPSL